MGRIQTKRVYAAPSPDDGERFLVDRLWPRGAKKESLHLAGWLKKAAPSDGLRKWFNHEPAKWEEFQRRYFAELKSHSEAWQPLLQAAREGNLTLVYSAKAAEHNNAVALKAFLEGVLKTLSQE